MSEFDLTKVPPYYVPYIQRVSHESLLDSLVHGRDYTLNILAQLDEDKGNYAYAPGKWTVKELLQHITDSERVFAYRAMCIARGEKTALPGYEQDDYVENSAVKDRSLADVVEEFDHTRMSTIALCKSFDREQLARFGNANGVDIGVEALGYIIAGHCDHHTRILEERYL